MKRALLVLSLFFSFCAFGGELTKLNSEWLLANESKIESSLKSQNNIEVMPIINTLGSIWINRDGALGSEVSPYIAKALIYKPDSMLAWFSQHTVELNAWLESVPSDLLTNYSGSASYTEFLVTLKEELRVTMTNYQGEHIQLARNIANAVSAIDISEID